MRRKGDERDGSLGEGGESEMKSSGWGEGGGWRKGNGEAVNGRQATRRIAREKRNDGVVSGRWKAEGFDAG